MATRAVTMEAVLAVAAGLQTSRSLPTGLDEPPVTGFGSCAIRFCIATSLYNWRQPEAAHSVVPAPNNTLWTRHHRSHDPRRVDPVQLQ